MVYREYFDDIAHRSDVDSSEDEDYNDTVHLNSEDWQTKYSDELWTLWDMIQQLVRDAFLEDTLLTECDFSDFAEFCYEEHTDDCDFIWFPYESTISYIWRHIQDFLEDAGLYNEFMPGATYDHWVRFVAHHSKQNNVTVY